MDAAERARFEEANKRVHPVTEQWHHPIMTRYGFRPLTKEAVGFVRSYEYVHPSGHVFVVSTGYSADHWREVGTKKSGYWSELEPYIKGLGL